MRLSNAKAKTWRRCPKQFEFKYVHKLRPKRRKSHLELGTWVHELLMVYYDEEDWKQKHRVLKAKFNNLFDEEKEELGDIPGEALRLFKSYLRHYKKEDVEQRTIDTELDEIVTLPNGIELNIVIDRIYEDRNGLWLQDHKTLSKFLPPDFMLLDAQLTIYFTAAEMLGYTPLLGVEFNQIRTKPPAIPHVNQDGFLSRAQKIDTDYWTYLEAIKNLDQDPKSKIYRPKLEELWNREKTDSRFFRRSRLPKDKPVTKNMMADLETTAEEIEGAENRGKFPRSPDKSCEWGCDYLDLCVLSLHGGDISNTVKLKYESRKRNEEDDYAQLPDSKGTNKSSHKKNQGRGRGNRRSRRSSNRRGIRSR